MNKNVLEIEELIKKLEDEINEKEKQIEKKLEIEVIYHLGDIHIPGSIEREKEYETVLERTIEIISKDSRKKMVVICGDLFHDKTKPYQEANILARNFMQGLGDQVETIIIQGNHDVNIDNEIRKDSIKSALLQLKTVYPIHYLTENKIYKINGINFGLTKMTNNKPTPIGIKNILELYIGLYHGTLYKSSTDEGYEFNDTTKIKGSDFKEYDIVMLGDIHKYQYLNKEKTIAYSGSLVQQNFGETINAHGMLLWDLKTKSSKLIEVPNDYIYKTHIITDIKNYEIPDIANKLCRLRILYKGVERLDLIKYEKEIKTRYNIIQLVKQEIIDDEVITKKTNDNSVQNKKFMDVYMEYLKNNKIKENEKATEELLKMVEEEQKKIVEVKREIKLYELEFENLLTYGSGNKILFEKLNGINILTGMNGIGKSSLIDIILFTIYNKFSREGRGKEALNIRHTKGYSILKLELNGEKYTIFRGINKDKSESYLFKEYPEKETIFNEILKIKADNKKGKKEIKNQSDDGKKEIDNQIISLFGKYDDMVMTSIILQVGIQFIDLKSEDKKNKMIEFFGLNSYDIIFNKVKSLYNTCTRTDIPKIKKELKNLNYEEILKKIYDEKNTIDNELNDINELLCIITKEKNILEYTNKNYIDTYDINVMIDDKEKITNKIKKIENDIVQYKKNLKEPLKILEINKIQNQEEIISLSKKIKNLVHNKKKINDEIQKHQKNILLNINDIENYQIKIIEIEKEMNLIIENFKNVVDLEVILKELENQLKKIKDKEKIYKIIENSLNIHNENNKYLISHKFNENCVCCLNNRNIHNEIGYIEKIKELEKELNDNLYDKNEKNEVEEKINILKKYFMLKNTYELNKSKLEVLIEKNEKDNNQLNLYNDMIETIKNNEKYEVEINTLEDENIQISEKIKIYDILEKNHDELILLNEKIELINAKIKEYNENSLNYEKYKKILNEEKKLLEKKNMIDINVKKIIIKITQIENEYEIEKENLKKIKLLYEDEKILRYINSLFKGGFIEYIMSYKLNILINKMNNILRNLGSYEITTEMNKDGIIFYKMKDDEPKLNVLKLCGYERIIFNISLRLALNSMNLFYKNNFMVIDEGFSAADNINIHKFQNIMELIKKEYDICILISHIDEIKNTKGKIMKIKYDTNTKDSNINVI
jgi:DNA repair exonuclease SbcCD nuclease subunit/DNA repair exonuclease SbcCD ATPase subunit